MENRSSAAQTGRNPILDSVEVVTGDHPAAAVIWLHGLGADGHDFEPIVPHLGLPASMPVRFVFPHAPVRPVTLNNGFRMRAWYDIKAISASRDQDEQGISESAQMVSALIRREQERGIAASRVVLAGFSQGGAIALYLALRFPQRLAGIMGLSTYLLFPERLASERDPANGATPVFLGHGTMDPMVPFSMGETTAHELGGLEYPVSWHQYPIPHAVSPEEISDVGAWLRICLAPG